MTRTLILTSAGTATAVAILGTIARIDGLEVVTTDVGEAATICAPTLFSTRHRVVPYAREPEAFVAAIAAICAETGADAVYPIHDGEIRALAAAADRLPPGVRLAARDAAAVDLCGDKRAAARHCVAAGIPAPTTVTGAELADDAIFPLFRKPRRGVGSVGARLVADRSALRPEDLVDDVVFQEVCTGPEYTVDVLRRGDAIVAIARERLEIKAGVSTKVRVFRDARFEALAAAVAAAFDTPDLFCFQAMDSARGLLVTDVNPRSGGGSSMTTAAGVDLYTPFFLDLVGLPGAEAAFEEARARAASLSPTLVCRAWRDVATRVESPRP